MGKRVNRLAGSRVEMKLKKALPALQWVKKNNSGFSLIELLTTMTLLLLLSVVAIIRFPRTAKDTLSAETMAKQAQADARLAQRLAISNNQRYDVEFLDASEGTTSPYKKYRIKNVNTGEIYRSEYYAISSNITAASLNSAQKLSFYWDGSCKILDSSDNTNALLSTGGVRFSAGAAVADLKAVESTGNVYVLLTR